MQVLEFVEMVLEKVESQVKPEDFLIYKSARPKDLSILLKQETQFANSGPRYGKYSMKLMDFLWNFPLFSDILKWMSQNQ